MIQDVVLTPSLAKADFFALCAEADITHIVYFQSSFKIALRPNGKEFIPAFLTLDEFNRVRKALEKSKYRILVMLGEARIGIPLETYDIRTWDAFRDLMLSRFDSVPVKLPEGLLPREHGAYTEVANKSMGNSILNQTQTLLYRVPKTLRKEVQKDVYSYLAGTSPHFNRAGEYSSLLILLASEHMQNLRKASMEAHKIGIEKAASKFKVDRFDIGYLRTFKLE